MSKDKPRFSIVTPAYNAERYIGKMIDSVQRQIFPDWELRVVDDGSSDSTRSIIEEAAALDSRIKPIFLAENSGSCFLPRRLATESSRGDYVVNVDADDTIEPEYLMKLLKRIKETDAEIVYADMYHAHDGEPPFKVIPNDESYYAYEGDGETLYGLTLDQWDISGMCAMDRHLALTSLKSFDQEFGTGHNGSFDNENLTRHDLLHARKIAFCDAVYYYRQVPDSVTHKISPRKFDLLEADMQLCNFVSRHFGPESDEYILAQRQLFHHVIEFMRDLNRHSSLAASSRARNITLKAFNSIDFQRIHGYVSKRYWTLMQRGYRFTKFILAIYERGKRG